MMSDSTPIFDTLIYNGIVLPIDDDMTVYKNGYVAITGSKIASVTPHENGDDLPPAKNYVDAKGGIIMPGFVNPHTHIPMSCFRGMGDDIPNRLIRFLFPLEREHMNASVAHASTNLSLLESFASGVTCLADMYYFETEIARACHNAHMRAYAGQTVMSRPAPGFTNYTEAVDTLPPLLEYCQDSDLVDAAIAPHAPYTLEHDDLIATANMAEKHNLPILMHVGETVQECDIVAERSGGKSPVQYLHDVGLINHRMVAGHCLHLNDDDWDIMVANDAGAVHNMSANLKSAKGKIMNLPTATAKGARVGIGTDGPISGNTIDVIGQLPLIAKAQKFLNDDASLFPCEQLVRLSTIGGASALHMEDKIGSLTVGKEADVIIVSTDHPRMYPIYDPYTVLVYSAQASDVRSTFVGGRMVYDRGNYMTLDKEQILQTAETLFAQYAQRVDLPYYRHQN